MTNLTALLTITRREITRFLRIWTQSLIPPILTSTLFILIFGYSLGSQISDIAGVSYIEFIVPGLVMMGVIMSAYMGTSFSLYIQKWHHSIDELLVAPIPYWHIIAGITIAGVLRGLFVGLGILLVSMMFTSITITNFWILFLFIVLVAFLFSFAGIATALWADNFDQVNVFSTFVITPFVYLGGVFYSIQTLPEFWGQVAQFNPILYLVDGFRYGFIGFHDVSLVASFSLLIGLTLFFFLLCVHLFRIGYKLRT
jgi:ABC-2 type transport system permease protein